MSLFINFKTSFAQSILGLPNNLSNSNFVRFVPKNSAALLHASPFSDSVSTKTPSKSIRIA